MTVKDNYLIRPLMVNTGFLDQITIAVGYHFAQGNHKSNKFVTTKNSDVKTNDLYLNFL